MDLNFGCIQYNPYYTTECITIKWVIMSTALRPKTFVINPYNAEQQYEIELYNDVLSVHKMTFKHNFASHKNNFLILWCFTFKIKKS